MRNPWLDIPSADYVAHMSSPEVGQFSVLNRLLCGVLATTTPRDLLLLGCSNGNGLEHVNPAVTRRVSAVDINPQYLRELASRFPTPAFRLERFEADVATHPFGHEEFDLVHGALLFEYIEWPDVVPRLAQALRPAGVLSVVLQRPTDVTPAVTRTAFTSLRRLDSVFRFVDPSAVVARAACSGLRLRRARIEPLASGKAFTVVESTKPQRGELAVASVCTG
jgi:SAM-dependent methyltransferase